ncbi:hypothetical protein [Paraburkholderia sp. BL10I2N1]|uniref:hypothetical protein n=1 Tax=Paraburkholderia sp. BL10I2N1 TaxID=1938796 RepID=UPI00105DBA79|nr:hypothetical protein [Paraburkholderia sp. BL10I2N1]TDN69826.1 hypothetical protein B0G77_3246 [Paraburkholderia sp. BL10I2N1]
MNKPSERIVVFVTPAQKRAITSTAEGLGISVSELMRRAVLSFGATSEQVKAASIVDRLRAPREPDALNEALRKVARGTRHTHGTATPALPPARARNALPPPSTSSISDGADAAPVPFQDELHASSRMPLPARSGASFKDASALAEDLPDATPPFDPATATEEEMRNAAEAVARVAAAKAAALAAGPNPTADAAHASGPDTSRQRPCLAPAPVDDDPDAADPSSKDGRFA